jgi:hypothetical protein
MTLYCVSKLRVNSREPTFTPRLVTAGLSPRARVVILRQKY